MKQRRDWPVASGESSLSTRIRGSESKSVTGWWLSLGLPLFIGAFFMGWGRMPFFMRPGVPNPIAVIIGVIFLAMLARAVWETIRLKRFGDPVLDLTQVPVPLGGTVEGRISLSPGLTGAPQFNLRLQCIRRVLQRSGKNSHWVETVLWTSEKTASVLPGGLVPVSMSVPPDQEETNLSDLSTQVVWRLTVRAPFRGPAFLERYPIPVEGRTSAAQKIVEERARSGGALVTGRTTFRAMLPFLIVGLAIMAGGLYLLSLGVGDLRKASASADWPTVPGQMRSSIPPRGSAIFVSRTDSDFAYTYSVNGTTFSGHVVYPHILWRRSAAVEMAKTYPPGASVTVFYAPKDPADSCLIAGLRAGALQRVVMALLVLTFGFLFAASAVLAPRDAVLSGNSYTFRQGSMGSRVMGYSFLGLLIWAVVLWWVS